MSEATAAPRPKNPRREGRAAGCCVFASLFVSSGGKIEGFDCFDIGWLGNREAGSTANGQTR
jgi:hypothetical protein